MSRLLFVKLIFISYFIIYNFFIFIIDIFFKCIKILFIIIEINNVLFISLYVCSALILVFNIYNFDFNF